MVYFLQGAIAFSGMLLALLVLYVESRAVIFVRDAPVPVPSVNHVVTIIVCVDIIRVWLFVLRFVRALLYVYAYGCS